jgi:flagellar hook-associated protein 2
MSRTQAAANARATVNGLTVTSASNTLEEVVEGVTLKLGKVSASPVEVTVSSNTESIKKSITDFATAYNDLAKYQSTQTRYDSASKTAGSLQGDASVNALRSALRGVGTGSVSASRHLPAPGGHRTGPAVRRHAEGVTTASSPRRWATWAR